MMISAASLLSLVGAVQVRRDTGASPSSTTAAADASKTDDRAALKLQQAQSAIATLESVKRNQGADVKARAKQKVEELKSRLQALRLIYANDPKKLAHAAAQIARELSAAAKNYASAGGQASDLGTAADTGSVSLPNATDAATPETGATTAVPTATAAADGGATETGDKAGQATATSPSTGATSNAVKGDAQTEADAEFAREARQIARQLKEILRRREQQQARDDADRAAGERSVAEAEATLDTFSTGSVDVAEAMAVTI